MQISPPSVKTTVKDSTPQVGQISKRRLFFLLATAAIASSLGIGLGSTLRFQVISVGQTPLFTPQQDFPPLAEWPPQVPSSIDDFDPGWNNDEPPSQLVYNEPPVSTDFDADTYSEEDSVSEQSVIIEDTTRPTISSLDDENVVQDVVEEAYNTYDERAIPELVNADKFENEDIESLDTSQIEGPESVSESYPWFDKRPMSGAEFTDGPVIIAPVDSSTVPEASLD